jgi:hypothetical protein
MQNDSNRLRRNLPGSLDQALSQLNCLLRIHRDPLYRLAKVDPDRLSVLVGPNRKRKISVIHCAQPALAECPFRSPVNLILKPLTRRLLVFKQLSHFGRHTFTVMLK